MCLCSISITVEPHWNVNLFSHPHNFVNQIITVEPYWNVNYIPLPPLHHSKIITVEPYWNLNNLSLQMVVQECRKLMT